jgi:hypothetical protein
LSLSPSRRLEFASPCRLARKKSELVSAPGGVTVGTSHGDRYRDRDREVIRERDHRDRDTVVIRKSRDRDHDRDYDRDRKTVIIDR